MCYDAKRRGQAELRSKPLASRVRYDQRSGHVIIELNNGCTLTIPTRLLQGLQHSTPRDLDQVEIMGPGLAIQWPTLDMQFTIAGLSAGRGGKARSRAKARAARRNGRKRGRPRKNQMAGRVPVP